MTRAREDHVEVEDQRPSLVRMYGAVAWLALVVLAIAVGLVYGRVAVGRLMVGLEDQAFAFAQRFALATWPQVRHLALDAGRAAPDGLRASREVETIRARLEDWSRDHPVVDARLIAEDGTIVFAIDPDLIGRATTNPVVGDMIAGRYFGRRRPDTATDQDGGRVTTHVAIRADSREVEAVLVIVQDAAPALRRITRIQAVGIGSAIGVFTLAILLVYGLWPASGRSREGEQ